MSGPARPLVSVLTPSLDQARFIRDTIESVLGQDYPRLELVVADGGSRDGTQEILRGYGDRVRWVSEPDAGQADALNKAFAASRGSIVGWLNSDDFYLWDGVVSAVVETFEREPDAAVVYGHSVWVDEARRVVKVHPRPRFSAERLGRFDYISQPATFFRRDGLEAPLVDETLEFALDYDLWLRMLARGRGFVRLDDYLAAMRYHADAKSVRARERHWSEDAAVRSVSQASRRTRWRTVTDLGLMAGLKLRGLGEFRAGALHRPRWLVELDLPPAGLRPLYQAGLLGSRGSALLLPRYFLASSRARGRSW
ncbi:MAG TPA: glycosyltransferase family 2 protein [Gaiellaceae bacterium]|nr:glycosyltransferase family 2 protein [Gaiellaceae bacterium]